MSRLPLFLVLSLLAGCQTGAPKAPEYIEVEVVRYVGVPAELTEPCPTDAPREQTYAEAKRLALSRLAIIEMCANADKAKIRKLGAEQEANMRALGAKP